MANLLTLEQMGLSDEIWADISPSKSEDGYIIAMRRIRVSRIVVDFDGKEVTIEGKVFKFAPKLEENGSVGYGQSIAGNEYPVLPRAFRATDEFIVAADEGQAGRFLGPATLLQDDPEGALNGVNLVMGEYTFFMRIALTTPVVIKQMILQTIEALKHRGAL